MGLTGLKNIEHMSRASSERLLAWLKTQTGLHRMQVLQVEHEETEGHTIRRDTFSGGGWFTSSSRNLDSTPLGTCAMALQVSLARPEASGRGGRKP
jgi:hypothetical protein